LAGGAASASVSGTSLRAVIEAVIALHPGLSGRIIDAEGVRPEVFLAIGDEEAFGLDVALADGAEVFIMPAIAGGA